MKSSRNQLWPILALLSVFVVFALYHFMIQDEVDGDDLSSSYVGCRVIAEGQRSHLYAYDPKNFAAVGPDSAWQHAADAGNYLAFLHPYVQTPLWGYSLLPLCRHTTWHQFQWIFAVLALLTFSAILVLVARLWAPIFLHPLAMACLLLAIWFFEPFQYSMTLMQTHVFFVLATLAAVMLADRDWPVTAGLLLAVAITVKLTPGVLVVYWLVRRQWGAALAAVGWFAVLWMATRSLAGPELMATYSATIGRISHTLLLSFNNQSFAAWWMDHFRHIPSESFEPLPLPEALRLTCTALLGLTAVAGGWLDSRHLRGTVQAVPQIHTVPLGALVTVVGATTFAPIEWTHYSIVLIAPLMVLLQSARTYRSLWILPAAAVILLLNLPPLAADPYLETLPRFAILRGPFFSEVLCLLALIAVSVGMSRSHRTA